MKNPCRNCLVKAACTDVCKNKTTYGIILNGKVKRYREYTRERYYDRYIIKRLEYYEKTSQKHFREIRNIIRREEGLL